MPIAIVRKMPTAIVTRARVHTTRCSARARPPPCSDELRHLHWGVGRGLRAAAHAVGQAVRRAAPARSHQPRRQPESLVEVPCRYERDVVWRVAGPPGGVAGLKAEAPLRSFFPTTKTGGPPPR